MLHCNIESANQAVEMKSASGTLGGGNKGWESSRKRGEKMVYCACLVIIGVNALLVLFL